MAQKDGEGRNPHVIMPGEKSHLYLFFFQENETCLVPNSPGPAVMTCCNYPVLNWYLKHPAEKLRGLHCVPRSWHIFQ